MIDSVIRFLQAYGIDSAISVPAATIAAAIAAILFIVAIELIIKKVLIRFIVSFAARTPTRFDDLLVDHNVFAGLARMSPPVLLHLFSGPVLRHYPDTIPFVHDGAILYFTVVIVMVLFSTLDALYDYTIEHPAVKRLPVKSFIQVLKTLIVFIALIFAVSKLLGKSPVVFLSGLGAFTAVLLLIFKDSLLGLVAGIQLSANNLVRVGDWIEMPKYGANGDVIDISLVTVSIQNSDKSVVVLPSYTLISEGFKNWRGMKESEGRRIKRSFYIDMASIRFCDDALLQKLGDIQLLKSYLKTKIEEITDYNSRMNIDPRSQVNGRRLTNIGTFRAYLTAYIHQLPQINSSMTLVVRYLQPEGLGLPIEIYCFSSDKEWSNFESIQADITDHVLAVLPFFGLRVFQRK